MDRLFDALPYFAVSWFCFTLYVLVKLGKVADSVSEYYRAKTTLMRQKWRKEQYGNSGASDWEDVDRDRGK